VYKFQTKKDAMGGAHVAIEIPVHEFPSESVFLLSFCNDISSFGLLFMWN
jgi:hypothetical protein